MFVYRVRGWMRVCCILFEKWEKPVENTCKKMGENPWSTGFPDFLHVFFGMIRRVAAAGRVMHLFPGMFFAFCCRFNWHSFSIFSLFVDLRQPQVAIFTFFGGRFVFVAILLPIIFQQISLVFDLHQPQVGGNIELRRCWTVLSQVGEKVELQLRR